MPSLLPLKQFLPSLQLTLTFVCMSVILNIETSSQVCSVCLSLDGKVLALKESYEEQNHASIINVLIDDLFKESGKSFADLSAVAVSSGPGSYTGLRIGVSTAKGICYALNLPLIAVNTLEAMVWGYGKQNFSSSSASDVLNNVLLCPIIDARRMEVYYGLYNFFGECLLAPENVILSADFLSAYSDYNIHFFGSGAEKTSSFISADKRHLSNNFVPSSIFLSEISFDRFAKNNFVSLAYFEPNYIKPVHITK